MHRVAEYSLELQSGLLVSTAVLADVSENEAIVASTSAPTFGLGHSSESEHEPEPPSPDIKAFHGDSKPHQQDSASSPTDTVASENAFTQSAARRSTDSARHSMDSTSAMPIGSVASHRSRRPPLRANSTFASRDGLHRQAAVKMVLHKSPPCTPANCPSSNIAAAFACAAIYNRACWL